LYVVAIPLAAVNAWFAVGVFVFVALIWFVPDRRIEARLGTAPASTRPVAD
jgi:p-aminobenzoyl-glutamate transporter AbgT